MAHQFTFSKKDWPELFYCPKCRKLALAFDMDTALYYCKDGGCGFRGQKD